MTDPQLLGYWPWPLKPGDPKHGTRDGYIDWRCHCPECKASVKGRPKAAE